LDAAPARGIQVARCGARGKDRRRHIESFYGAVRQALNEEPQTFAEEQSSPVAFRPVAEREELLN
jgi:hypothetical protein